MKKQICAQVVADSQNMSGGRITTFIVTMPRIVLAEFNTHRAFSRNSASSRARPFKVMLKDVQDDPFVPIRWMSTHKGMQGTEYLNEEESKVATQNWLEARDAAVASAIKLDQLQVTKQIVNRLLEPFLWHQVIVTATEFENFFALRAHPDAEIHICKLAEVMLEAYNASQPKFLHAGEFHIPFGDNIDEERVKVLALSELGGECDDAIILKQTVESIKKKIACARCARISYKPFGSENMYDYEADCRLFQTLLDGGHMSPLEHCAYAMRFEDQMSLKYSGNFRGFVQYRKEFVNETQHDVRVKRPPVKTTEIKL